MFSKKSLLCVVLVAVLLLAITSVASAIDWRQAEGTTVSVLLNKHTFTDSIQPYLEEFEALTGIKVEPYIISEQQFWDKQRMVLATGSDEYDVTMMALMSTWEYEEVLEPLNEYIDNPELTDAAWDKNDFFEGFLESNTVRGKLYAIPVMAEVYMLQYRKDIFDEFGLTVPETFEEYIETIKLLDTNLEQAGYNMDALAARGIRSPGMVTVGFSTFFWGQCATDFDENGKCVVNSPEGIKATQMYVDLIHAGASPDWASYDWYDVKDALTSGRAAVGHDCNFFAIEQNDPEISQVAGKMAYAELPSGPCGNVSSTHTWGLSINRASKNKKGAWLFIQWATSKEALLRSALEYNSFDPTRKSVWNHPDLIEQIKSMANYREVDTKILEKARVLPTPNRQIMSFLDMWSVALQEVWMGSKTAEDAMNGLARDVDRSNFELLK